MKLQYKHIFDENFLNTLKYLSNEKLPVKLAVSIAKIIQTITQEQTIVFPVRDQLLKEYGVSGVSGGLPILEDSNKLEEFSGKIGELMSSEFDLPVADKLVLPDNIEITSTQILTLEAILEF